MVRSCETSIFRWIQTLDFLKIRILVLKYFQNVVFALLEVDGGAGVVVIGDRTGLVQILVFSI